MYTGSVYEVNSPSLTVTETCYQSALTSASDGLLKTWAGYFVTPQLISFKRLCQPPYSPMLVITAINTHCILLLNVGFSAWQLREKEIL
jgi:hypothetical protein